MQKAGIPTSLCGYADLITAWETPEDDRGGAMYMALTDLIEHYKRMRMTEQNMLDTRVRRTSRLLSSLQLTIQELEHTLEMIIVPMFVPENRTLQFFSKSANTADLGAGVPSNWRRVLSNFYPSQISVNGHTYPTSEHAFHAAKALSSSDPSMALDFIVGGKVGPLASAAKVAGGKAAYAKNKTVLKLGEWISKRDTVQREITASRLQQDPLFTSILTAIGHRRIRLVHFDRSGSKSYWGGVVDPLTGTVRGTNKLGIILTEEASKLSSFA
jgi:predicted NAD-dependent protein-ADP-ribosyltransferase YbiA (DUF1768 family)